MNPRLRDARAAILVGLAFLVAAAAIAGIGLARERRLLLDQAHKNAGTLTALFEENTARTFDGVDNVLEGIAAYVSTVKPPKDDRATRDTMRARLRFVPTVRAIFVIGADGFIIHDTDYPKTPAVSLADRPYFRQYLLNESLVRAVSEPLQSRSGAGWFVASTRRITAADGKLLGVAVAAVQLDTISTLYRKLDLQSGQQVSLLQSNGTLLASHPGNGVTIGQNYANQPIFAQKLLQQRSGIFVGSGAPLGYDRIVSYRALESQPLIVVVTSRIENVLAPWNRAVAGALAGLVVLALLTSGIVLFFIQRQRERQRTQLHQAAEAEATAVAAANAKFRAFFEQGSMFACVVAPDGELLEVNQADRDSAARIEPGVKFWACSWWAVPPSQPAALREGFARAAAGETFRRECSFQLPGGQFQLVELAMSPIRGPQGEVLAVAAVCVDITERKHQEEQLRVLARDLSEVDRRRSEFLATLSHELRNVLTPVQNCAQILRMAEPGSPQALRARDVLTTQLQQMRRLVDDLLDVSRINSGKVQLALEAFDLRGVLAEASAAAHSSMERAGHHFEMEVPPGELMLNADPARLRQVFANLLGNAAKYTPPGGRVLVRARREGHEAIVEVSDNGIGIPVDAQVRIFEMFEQVVSHAEHSEGGLGIGLGLVHRIVALHGGHVEAHSEGAGRGSTFTVYLPLADAPASARPATGSHPHALGK